VYVDISVDFGKREFNKLQENVDKNLLILLRGHLSKDWGAMYVFVFVWLTKKQKEKGKNKEKMKRKKIEGKWDGGKGKIIARVTSQFYLRSFILAVISSQLYHRSCDETILPQREREVSEWESEMNRERDIN